MAKDPRFFKKIREFLGVHDKSVALGVGKAGSSALAPEIQSLHQVKRIGEKPVPVYSQQQPKSAIDIEKGLREITSAKAYLARLTPKQLEQNKAVVETLRKQIANRERLLTHEWNKSQTQDQNLRRQIEKSQIQSSKPLSRSAPLTSSGGSKNTGRKMAIGAAGLLAVGVAGASAALAKSQRKALIEGDMVTKPKPEQIKDPDLHNKPGAEGGVSKVGPKPAAKDGGQTPPYVSDKQNAPADKMSEKKPSLPKKPGKESPATAAVPPSGGGKESSGTPSSPGNKDKGGPDKGGTNKGDGDKGSQRGGGSQKQPPKKPQKGNDGGGDVIGKVSSLLVGAGTAAIGAAALIAALKKNKNKINIVVPPAPPAPPVPPVPPNPQPDPPEPEPDPEPDPTPEPEKPDENKKKEEEFNFFKLLLLQMLPVLAPAMAAALIKLVEKFLGLDGTKPDEKKEGDQDKEKEEKDENEDGGAVPTPKPKPKPETITDRTIPAIPITPVLPAKSEPANTQSPATHVIQPLNPASSGNAFPTALLPAISNVNTNTNTNTLGTLDHACKSTDTRVTLEQLKDTSDKNAALGQRLEELSKQSTGHADRVKGIEEKIEKLQGQNTQQQSNTVNKLKLFSDNKFSFVLNLFNPITPCPKDALSKKDQPSIPNQPEEQPKTPKANRNPETPTEPTTQPVVPPSIPTTEEQPTPPTDHPVHPTPEQVQEEIKQVKKQEQEAITEAEKNKKQEEDKISDQIKEHDKEIKTINDDLNQKMVSFRGTQNKDYNPQLLPIPENASSVEKGKILSANVDKLEQTNRLIQDEIKQNETRMKGFEQARDNLKNPLTDMPNETQQKIRSDTTGIMEDVRISHANAREAADKNIHEQKNSFNNAIHEISARNEALNQKMDENTKQKRGLSLQVDRITEPKNTKRKPPE